ncbi:hypothetical protein Tco_1531445 [Tanacetum coccineum]
MHTRASNSELVEPLPEPERTLNRRLHRRNRRVPFEQRNEPPEHPKVVYALILDINHFCHFLYTLENYNPIDDEPMGAADRVVALTPGSTISIPETANEFAIKGNYLTLVKGNQFDGTSFNGQKQQRIVINADALYNEKQENLRVCSSLGHQCQMTFEHSSSSLGHQCQMASAKITLQAPFLNVQKTFDRSRSSLVLHQMTSDHNRSELRIQDHSNEQSSSKLVPRIVPLAVKTATSRQELELLFHHHKAMLRTTVNTSSTDSQMHNNIMAAGSKDRPPMLGPGRYSQQSIWYQQAFARLFGDSFRTFKFQLSQHMNNLETLLNAETLHERDPNPLKCDQSDSLKKDASQSKRLKMTLKKLSERQLQIQQCKVQEVQSSLTIS